MTGEVPIAWSEVPGTHVKEVVESNDPGSYLLRYVPHGGKAGPSLISNDFCGESFWCGIVYSGT